MEHSKPTPIVNGRPLFSRQCRHARPVHLPYSGLVPPTRTVIFLAPNQVTYQLAQHEKVRLRDDELNVISLGYEPNGLPAPSTREIMAPEVGIEPTMPFGDGLTVRCVTAPRTLE